MKRKQKNLKLYLETSVWSHYYSSDAKTEMEYTRLFFKTVEYKLYEIYIAFTVNAEIDDAKTDKKLKLRNLITRYNPVELEIIPEV